MIYYPLQQDMSRNNGAEEPWRPGPRVAGSTQTYLPTHHNQTCAHGGSTFEEVSANDELCACDPDGSKAQEMLDWKRKWDRSHVLHQKKVWYDATGKEIRLKDMSLRYKRNVLNFLERRAARFKLREELQITAAASSMNGEMARASMDSLLWDTIETEPLVWLHEQPLVKRLVKLIDKGQDGPID